MARLNALTSMILSLSPAELTHVSRQMRGKKQEIFNEMATKKTIEQKKLGGRIAALKPCSFIVYRSLIAKEIGPIITAYRQRANPMHQVWALRQTAEAMRAVGQYAQAAITLGKAAEHLEELEDFAGAASLHAEISLLELEDNPKWASCQAKILKLNAQERELNRLRDWTSETQSLDQYQHSKRTQGAREFLAKIAALANSVGIKATFTRQWIKGHCQSLLLDTAAAGITFGEAVDLAMQNPMILHDPHVLILFTRATISLSAHLRMLGMVPKAVALIDRIFTLFQSLHIAAPPRLKEEVLRNQVKGAIQSGDEARFQLLSKQLLGKIASSGKEMTMTTRRYSALVMAEHHIVLHEPRQALRWVHVALDTRKVRTLPESITVAGIMEIIALIMMEDFESLAEAVARFRYHCERRGQWNEYTRIVDEGFLEVAKSMHASRALLTQIKANVEALESGLEGELAMKMFDLSSWLDARLSANSK